jgi:hypothetical protein
MTNKKYILKPGKHQFAPGSHPVHYNENMSDEEAEWYLERYPHIASLFAERLECCKVEMLAGEISEHTENTTSEAVEPEAVHPPQPPEQ